MDKPNAEIKISYPAPIKMLRFYIRFTFIVRNGRFRYNVDNFGEIQWRQYTVNVEKH